MLEDIVSKNTMCSKPRIRSLASALEQVITNNIAGDFVECGTWRGGLGALILDSVVNKSKDKKLYIYDTFEGMPKPSEQDDQRAVEEYAKMCDGEYSDWCRAGQDAVKHTLSHVCEDYQDYCVFVQGMVETTLDQTVPDTIALCRVDTDWYESTKKEFEVLYPRLSPGGIFIVDDYTDWKGCKKATDEYLNKLDPDTYTTTTVDGSMVIFKK
jgi:O-methyltransferase